MFQLLLKYLYLLLIFIKVNSETHINPSYKYILKWNRDRNFINDAGEGRDQFLERNCQYNNCYITSNRKYFKNYTDFHVILFNGASTVKMGRKSWPKIRDPAQKYVFFAQESPDYYPVCINIFENFFNLTWTYKFNSDIIIPYMTIRDKHYNVIGPKLGIKWLSMRDMDDVNEELKLKLKSKKKLVAWFVSNWFPRSERVRYSLELNNVLLELGYKIDVYGKYGTYTCDKCLSMLENDYYFYLSFENSFAEDYVTEKLLHPLIHYTVPIVYGKADYSRFVPNGSYLDAIELGPQKLASIMINAMKHPEQYYKFFKWRNHYSYHYPSESPDTDVYCNFCKAINNRTLMEKGTSVKHFRKWWNPVGRCYFKKMEEERKRNKENINK